jgi:hypothetical protein
MGAVKVSRFGIVAAVARNGAERKDLARSGEDSG